MWEQVILHKLGVGRPCERVHLYSPIQRYQYIDTDSK